MYCAGEKINWVHNRPKLCGQNNLLTSSVPSRVFALLTSSLLFLSHAGRKACQICCGQFISQRQENVLQFLISDVVATTRVLPTKSQVRHFHIAIFQAVSKILDKTESSTQFMSQEVRVVPCSFCAYPFLETDHVARSMCERLMHELCEFSNEMLFQLKLDTIMALQKVKAS